MLFHVCGLLVAALVMINTAFVSPTFAAPDLYVSKFKLRPGNIDAGRGPSFLLGATNQGDATSAASNARLRIDENADGTWEHTLSLTLPPISAGDREILKWSTPWVAIAGLHAYELCADPDALSGDGDMTNNCVFQEFVVAGVPAAIFDLFVSSLSHGKAKAGQPLTFAGLVRNNGDSPGGRVLGGLYIDDVLMPIVLAGSAPPRGATRARWRHIWTATPGMHTCRACVASQEYGGDVNPTNDCVDGTFVVPN
jgi:hypothetical protein